MKIKRVIVGFSLFLVGFMSAEAALPGLFRSTAVAPAVSESLTGPQKLTFNQMVVRHATRLCNGGLHKIFAQDGSDFIDFWCTANEVNLPVEEAYTCCRLFYNNVKSCEAIDNTVVGRVLKVMPKLFERYFEKPKEPVGEFGAIRQKVEDMILGQLTEKFDSFRIEPDLFISRLANDITEKIKARFASIQVENTDKKYKERLRQILIRFNEHMLSKAIWYSEDYASIWSSFKSIADSLHVLGIRGMIPSQDVLDEFWTTLTTRFVWYIDLKGASLPVEFYEQIEDDLKSCVVLFLEAGEQDKGIESKKERIAKAIITGKAKAIATERGLALG